jgi:orotidine-5'-phosphate decarboxylase
MIAPKAFATRLHDRMQSINSLVCVGLDPVLAKLPSQFDRDAAGVVSFCQGIIEATLPVAAAYKPNLGFFAALGRTGFNALWAVRHAIPADVPVILDCKIGDVGETARAYAHGWLAEFGFDAITVSPWLGEDATAPYLEYADKGVIVLCKTSNPGSGDFQDVRTHAGEPMYLTVADRTRAWEVAYPASVGLVVGATYPEQLAEVRARVGDQVILLPGIGAQGGQLEASVRAGISSQGTGLLCSASRSILYAASDDRFGEAALEAATVIRNQANAVRDPFHASAKAPM